MFDYKKNYIFNEHRVHVNINGSPPKVMAL